METKDKVVVGAVATIVGVSMLNTCSSRREDAVSDWENAQGTQGFINLNDVRDAFRDNEAMPAFEKRVNEIFEGDNLVVFEAKEVNGGFEILAREDLDGSKSTTSKDDLLFTLQVKGRTATLKGAGVNDYYKESWLYEVPANAQQQMASSQHSHSSFASSPFFWWWVLSPGWGGYYTPMGRYNTIYSHRSTYRNSSAYQTQVSSNGRFGSSMSQKHGSTFRNSTSTPSAARKSYIRSTKQSPDFKSKLAASKSTTGSSARSQMRSSSGSKKSSFSGSSNKSSSSRGYGGFRGSSGFGI